MLCFCRNWKLELLWRRDRNGAGLIAAVTEDLLTIWIICETRERDFALEVLRLIFRLLLGLGTCDAVKQIREMLDVVII